MNKYVKIALFAVALSITVILLRQGLVKKEGTAPAGDPNTAETASTSKPEPASPPVTEAEPSQSEAQKSEPKTQTGSDYADVGAPVGAEAPPSATASKSGPAVAVVEKRANNCFSFEYQHKKEALQRDIEDFLDYSNAFPVLHEKVSSKSICVRVNNKPTAFKVVKNKNKEEIVIGSVVGPESVIKVSYCVGSSNCKESCVIKSNRVMDELMSDAGEEDNFKESWGEAAGQKKELQAKLKEFRNVASENRQIQKQATMRDWNTLSNNEWFCK